jgi:hypothetical protein
MAATDVPPNAQADIQGAQAERLTTRGFPTGSIKVLRIVIHSLARTGVVLGPMQSELIHGSSRAM